MVLSARSAGTRMRMQAKLCTRHRRQSPEFGALPQGDLVQRNLERAVIRVVVERIEGDGTVGRIGDLRWIAAVLSEFRKCDRPVERDRVEFTALDEKDARVRYLFPGRSCYAAPIFSIDK